MRDLFGNEIAPATPRALVGHELRALAKMGFPEVARRLTATDCEHCDEKLTGAFHAYACKYPTLAASSPVQPWVPRESRRAA